MSAANEGMTHNAVESMAGRKIEVASFFIDGTLPKVVCKEPHTTQKSCRDSVRRKKRTQPHAPRRAAMGRADGRLLSQGHIAQINPTLAMTNRFRHSRRQRKMAVNGQGRGWFAFSRNSLSQEVQLDNSKPVQTVRRGVAGRARDRLPDGAAGACPGRRGPSPKPRRCAAFPARARSRTRRRAQANACSAGTRPPRVRGRSRSPCSAATVWTTARTRSPMPSSAAAA